MQRYFVKIAYDGTDYAGWQIQPNVSTIQGEIEERLSRLFSNEQISIVGCGRTDAGVHASQFYFHADLPSKYAPDQLRYKLNNMLSASIAVFDVFTVDDDAHARFDAEERTYRYYIHHEKDPFVVGRSWYYPHQLNVDQMNRAATVLLGKKDFTSFSKLHTDVKTNICEVTKAEWTTRQEGKLVFEIKANRFLRNMVRAVVGTLVEVGKGAISVEDVKKVLEARDRGSAGMSVPAEGLFLSEVSYPFFRDHNKLH